MRSLAVNPIYDPTFWMLIAANAHLGRMGEARRHLAEFRRLDIALTPHGFLRAAMAATNPTAISLTLGSPTGAVTPNGKQTLVSFTLMGKYRVVGTFDDQNLLALVHNGLPAAGAR